MGRWQGAHDDGGRLDHPQNVAALAAALQSLQPHGQAVPQGLTLMRAGSHQPLQPYTYR